MLTGLKTDDLTIETVAAELENLEADYRARKRKLRALLGVLHAEAADEPCETDIDNESGKV